MLRVGDVVRTSLNSRYQVIEVRAAHLAVRVRVKCLTDERWNDDGGPNLWFGDYIFTLVERRAIQRNLPDWF